MIKLVVYDWNGTLLADSTAVLEGVNKELEVFGVPQITIEDYRNLYQVPIANFFYAVGVSEEVMRQKSMEAARVLHAYYEPRVAKARTRTGTRKTLKNLHDKDIQQVVLSNHTLEGIYLQIERLKFHDFFEDVLANDEIGKAHYEGKKDRLVRYLTEHRIKANEALIVGDTVEETEIGKSLGLATASITEGYNSTERLKNANPDYLITKVSDLIKIIDELNKGA